MPLRNLGFIKIKLSSQPSVRFCLEISSDGSFAIKLGSFRCDMKVSEGFPG